MNLFSIFRYDLYNGLLRWRYLVIPAIFLIPCVLCKRELDLVGIAGTCGDYLLYCFKGQLPVSEGSTLQDIALPTLWILVTGGCLYLNLDYAPKDMTSFGMQIIYRSKRKNDWYISKCLWNMVSCTAFFGIAFITVFLFSQLAGASAAIASSSSASIYIFQPTLHEPISLSAHQVITISLFLPFLTVYALSMLEMLLSIITKPIFGFLGCMLLLAGSAFGSSRWLLGGGAMAVRSAYVLPEGEFPLFIGSYAASVVFLCVIIGTVIFRKTDILSTEE